MIRLLIFLSFSLIIYSCNRKLTALEQEHGRWVSIEFYEPDDYAIFDFGKGELTTIESKTYKFKIKRNKFYWPDDNGFARAKISNVVLKDDTLKISGDDFYTVLLKHDGLVAPRSIVTDSLVGYLFRIVTLPENYQSDSINYYVEFVSAERGINNHVNRITGKMNQGVFSWSLHEVHGVFIVSSDKPWGPRYFITEHGNDTIKVVQPFTDHHKGFSTKTLLLIKEESVPPKVLIEDLVGDWEVANVSPPDHFVGVKSMRITQDRLFINEQSRGVKLDVRWYVDRFGNIILAKLEDPKDHDPRFNFYDFSIYFTERKLIFEDWQGTFELQKRP